MTAKWSPLDKHCGVLMTTSEFAECVDVGALTDYDGFGYYANEEEESDTLVELANILIGNQTFTHVMWYNN
jgi:hypothetical protein